MKLLIGTLLLGALGAGSLQLANRGAADSAPQCEPACEATVTCTPEGTCVITCERPDGTECRIELECDGGECRIVGCSGPEQCPPACTQTCPPNCR